MQIAVGLAMQTADGIVVQIAETEAMHIGVILMMESTETQTCLGQLDDSECWYSMCNLAKLAKLAKFAKCT